EALVAFRWRELRFDARFPHGLETLARETEADLDALQEFIDQLIRVHRCLQRSKRLGGGALAIEKEDAREVIGHRAVAIEREAPFQLRLSARCDLSGEGDFAENLEGLGVLRANLAKFAMAEAHARVVERDGGGAVVFRYEGATDRVALAPRFAVDEQLKFE